MNINFFLRLGSYLQITLNLKHNMKKNRKENLERI